MPEIIKLTSERGSVARIVNPAPMVFKLFGGRGPQGRPGSPGTPGQDGADGRDIELSVGDEYIRWRPVGEPSWTNLVAVSSLKGTDGQDGEDAQTVVLQATATHIQWKYSDEDNWHDLIALSVLKGADGQGVPTGGAAGQVLAKVTSANFNTAWINPPSGGGEGNSNVVVSNATPIDPIDNLIWVKVPL